MFFSTSELSLPLFLDLSTFNLYWWTTQALLQLPHKRFCDNHRHSTVCSSYGYSKQPKKNKIFFPCSCWRCLQTSPFLPLALYKECNHSCASSAHRSDQSLEVIFFSLGGRTSVFCAHQLGCCYLMCTL